MLPPTALRNTVNNIIVKPRQRCLRQCVARHICNREIWHLALATAAMNQTLLGQTK